MRFHHIGVVCDVLSNGKTRLEQLLGELEWSSPHKDEIQRVFVQFGTDSSGICYEIIAPLDALSPVSQALGQGKNILNHVAYTVPSISETSERLRQQGCLPLGKAQPAIAFDRAQIQFFVCPLRFIIELIEQGESAKKT